MDRGTQEKEQGEEKEEEEEEEEVEEKSSEGTYALSKCATLCALYATASSLCTELPCSLSHSFPVSLL